MNIEIVHVAFTKLQYKDLSWDCNSVLSRDVTSSLLESMIRDLNSTAQDLALKGHHIWTLGLFHQTLSRTFKREADLPKTVELENSMLAELLNNAAKGTNLDKMQKVFILRFPAFISLYCGDTHTHA